MKTPTKTKRSKSRTRKPRTAAQIFIDAAQEAFAEPNRDETGMVAIDAFRRGLREGAKEHGIEL